MLQIEKIRKLSLQELISLRDEVEHQYKRTFAGFNSIPSEENKDFSSLLERLNMEIKDKIKNEFFE